MDTNFQALVRVMNNLPPVHPAPTYAVFTVPGGYRVMSAIQLAKGLKTTTHHARTAAQLALIVANLEAAGYARA
jgi:hypothetical protein